MGSQIVPLVDLIRQTRQIRTDLLEAFLQVLSGGQFILGPEVRQFEQEFARFSGCRFGVGVASGTDALELALRACGVGPGDLVATVSFTFLATVDAVRHCGADPLFVDINPRTYTMDPRDLERRLDRLSSGQRRRVKAILPVHLFGHPCDMDALGRLARRHKLAVIEDAAQAAGARWKGHPVGGLGQAGCFSFFPSKNLGGFGDGGMVVTSSASISQRVRRLRVHGRDERGLEAELGRNSRLDELQAALLRVKLRRLTHWVKRRRILAQAYTRNLSDVSGVVCPETAAGGAHAFGLYVVRLPKRDAVLKRLGRAGICTQAYYAVPVHRQPLYASITRRLSLPETDRAAGELLALPLFPELRIGEVKAVCEAIRDSL